MFGIRFAIISLVLLPVMSHAQLFENTGDVEFVESLSFTTTDNPPNPPATVVDITFGNGNERGHVPVTDNFFDLPSFPVSCSCWEQGTLNAPTIRRTAYYYTPDLVEDNDIVFGYSDGLLIQSRPGEAELCVNQIRRNNVTVTVTAFTEVQECLAMPFVFPSIVVRPPLIEKYLEKIDFGLPDPWPGPVCLSCPPWKGYEQSMEGLAAAHEIELRKNIPVMIKQLEEFQSMLGN